MFSPDQVKSTLSNLTRHPRLRASRASARAACPPASACNPTSRHFGSILGELGIKYLTSTSPRGRITPTCGKVERFHQTLKKWLTRQPRAATIAELQAQLDAFVEEYNHCRPHRSLPHRATPATTYQARPKAAPGERLDTHDRVRTDRVDQAGVITLRVAGRLHHIGVGRTYTGTRVLVLVQDLNIKIINAATGEPIRQLTLDPTRDYQPTGAPQGPKRKKPRT